MCAVHNVALLCQDVRQRLPVPSQIDVACQLVACLAVTTGALRPETQTDITHIHTNQSPPGLPGQITR